MGLLPDTQNCGLRMHQECRERFPRHRLQRKQIVSDPGMHHGTCVTHVPWCMSGSLTRGVGEIVPGIPGVCATRNFAYLVRGPYCQSLVKIRFQSVSLFTDMSWQDIRGPFHFYGLTLIPTWIRNDMPIKVSDKNDLFIQRLQHWKSWMVINFIPHI